ncbi:MAG: copper chaperone PCu(A)C [Pseudomonadota bacterium]
MKNFFCQSSTLYLLSLLLTVSTTVTSAYAADTSGNLITIQNAWVRPTNTGQDVGAAYMTLTSTKDVVLTRVESDISDSVEIHSMTMQSGIMKMRMLDTLPLTAGKPYKLAPGGFHLMLFDLKKPLSIGQQVNFVLHFEMRNKQNKKSVELKQNVRAMVQPSAD